MIIGLFVGIIVGICAAYPMSKIGSLGNLIISDHSGEDSYLFLEINREDMKNLKQNDIVKFKVQDNRAVSRH